MVKNTRENYQFSIEFQLVLACLGNLENVDMHSICQSKFNWERFLHLVYWHKVTPLVYCELKKMLLNSGLQKKSFENALSGLKSHCMANAQRVLRFTAELSRITQILDKANIPTVSLKGPLLSYRLYNDLTMREPRDIDMLISIHQVADAHNVLSQNGYHRLFPSITLTNKQFNYYLKNKKDFIYRHKTLNIQLELHWRFFDNPALFDLTWADVWNKLSTEKITNQIFLVLPTEEEFLYLLTHGSQAAWFNLQGLCDIKQFMQNHQNLDWQKLILRAKELGVDRPLYEGVHLTHLLLNSPVSLGSSSGVCVLSGRRQNMKSIASLTKQSIKTLYYLRNPYSYSMRVFMLLRDFRLSTRWRYRVFLLKQIFTTFPEDWEMIVLPDKFFWVYHIVRPFCWMWRRVKKLSKICQYLILHFIVKAKPIVVILQKMKNEMKLILLKFIRILFTKFI